METKDIVILLIGLACSIPVSIIANLGTPRISSILNKRFASLRSRSEAKEFKRYLRLENIAKNPGRINFLLALLIVSASSFAATISMSFMLLAELTLNHHLDTSTAGVRDLQGYYFFAIAMIFMLSSIVCMNLMNRLLHDISDSTDFERYEKRLVERYGLKV